MGSEILLGHVQRARTRLRKQQLVCFGGFLNRVLDNTVTDACQGSKFFEGGYQSLNCKASRALKDSSDGQGWLCRSPRWIRVGMYLAVYLEVCVDTSDE